MSIFEELVALDRPYLSLTANIGGTDRKFLVRRLSAADQDALEAYGTDEYARQILARTEGIDGAQSEMERVKQTYKSRPRSELMEQIVGTRFQDVRTRALEILGEDYSDRAKNAEDIVDVSERMEAQKVLRLELNTAFESSKVDVATEYDTKTDEDIADIMSQVNINMKSMSEATSRQKARNLFYILFDENKHPVFPELDSVHSLSTESIDAILNASELAFTKAVPADLPFALPVDPERDKPTPSQSNSVAATKRSGKRTRTLRAV